METLSAEQIQDKLQKISGWVLDGDAIRRDWTFADFREAMAFLNKVAELAEAHNHHPEVFNVYNRLTLRFNTHDAGGITTRDFAIAEEINKL